MIKLGIIGTGWISDQFIEACAKTGMYRLTTVYSRTLQKAEEFGKKYLADGEYFDDLEKFFAEGSFDTVYIASPNSLHFAQSVMAINAGKNVIVEKPACANLKEENQLLDLLSKRNDVYYFEAARHVHEKNFEIVKQEVAKLEQSIRRAMMLFLKERIRTFSHRGLPAEHCRISASISSIAPFPGSGCRMMPSTFRSN